MLGMPEEPIKLVVILIATTAQLWWHTALSAYQAGLYVPKTTAQGIHRQINTDSQF